MKRKALAFLLFCFSYALSVQAFAYPVSLPIDLPYESANVSYDKYMMFRNQPGIYYAIYAATTRDLPHIYTYNGTLRAILNNSMKGKVLVYRYSGSSWVNSNSEIYDGGGISIDSGGNCSTTPIFFTNTDLVFNSDDIAPASLSYYKSSVVNTANYCNIPQPVKGSVFYSANAYPLLSLIIDPLAGGSITGDGISCNVNTCGFCKYSIAKNSQVTITANANFPNYLFSHWEDGQTQIPDNPYAVIMDKDKRLRAVFEPFFLYPSNGCTQNVFNYPVTQPKQTPFSEGGVTYDKYMMFHNQAGIYYAIYASTARDLPHIYGYSGNMRVTLNASMLGKVLVYRIDKNSTLPWSNYTASSLYDGSVIGVASGDNCSINPMFVTNEDLVFDLDDIAIASRTYYDGKITSANYCNIPQPVKGTTFYPATLFNKLTISASPAEGGGVTGNGISCNINSCAPCEYYPIQNAEITLTAQPNSGWIFSRWKVNNAESTEHPYHGFMEGDKNVEAVFEKFFSLQSSVKNQTFSADRIQHYRFTLSESTSVAILSGGLLDLKARVLNSYGEAVLDQNGSEYCDDYTDIGAAGSNGNHQINFMYRKQNLAAGTYTLEVTPKDANTLVNGQFSIVFLKKPTNSDEFFAGMDALLDDDDTSNDYLDIYVKALYPNFYPNVDSLVSVDDGHIYDFAEVNDDFGVKAARQCKALTKFYLRTILGRGDDIAGYVMEQDGTIRTNWNAFNDYDSNCIPDDDHIINNGNASLIYHSLYLSNPFGSGSCMDVDKKYFYNPETGQVARDNTGNLSSFVRRGDIFVQYLSSYNHYGLIYDESSVLDANASSDGKIHKAGFNEGGVRNTERWKVSRPE